MESTREIGRVSWLAAGAITTVIVVASYAYGAYGNAFVRRLDAANGEIVAERARALAARDNPEAAIAAYRAALRLPFDNPQHRLWARQRLAALQLASGSYDDAASELQALLKEGPGDLQTWSSLCEALAGAKQSAQLAATAEAWSRAAEEQNNSMHRALAKYYLGLANELQGNLDVALEAYLAGQSVEPDGLNAYHAAALLHAKGEDTRAAQMLDHYIPHANGWRLDAAKALRAQLTHP